MPDKLIFGVESTEVNKLWPSSFVVTALEGVCRPQELLDFDMVPGHPAVTDRGL